ncbi:hypothetical protein PAPYR_5839 [Paratrimastix pyriformis]|uniref:EF-hand domain-containing protein n=1 Tax=Paratrimastix pyriformis TaxID=342808 RepID=A0ABQ8UKG3_9EUKA|nr:hypothetical protein PAPYR_5839 [Paratrimastix pyriformis]
MLAGWSGPNVWTLLIEISDLDKDKGVSADGVSAALDVLDPIADAVGVFGKPAKIIFDLARGIMAVIKRHKETQLVLRSLSSLLLQLQMIMSTLARSEIPPTPDLELAIRNLQEILTQAGAVFEECDKTNNALKIIKQQKEYLERVSHSVYDQMQIVSLALQANIYRNVQSLVLRSDSQSQLLVNSGPKLLSDDANEFLAREFPGATTLEFIPLFQALQRRFPDLWRVESEDVLQTIMDLDGDGNIDLTEFAFFSRPTLRGALTRFFRRGCLPNQQPDLADRIGSSAFSPALSRSSSSRSSISYSPPPYAATATATSEPSPPAATTPLYQDQTFLPMTIRQYDLRIPDETPDQVEFFRCLLPTHPASIRVGPDSWDSLDDYFRSQIRITRQNPAFRSRAPAVLENGLRLLFIQNRDLADALSGTWPRRIILEPEWSQGRDLGEIMMIIRRELTQEGSIRSPHLSGN